MRIVYSTDANAGSHGANTDELVAYVEQGGQDPMDAVVSATSFAAESLGMEDRIGAIATGYEADIIALDGDPLTDPAALGRVVFVMRGGHVYKNGPPRAAERSTVQSRLSAAVRELVTPRGLEEQAAAIVRHQRPSGSAGERAAIDHIVETLRRDGVDVRGAHVSGIREHPDRGEPGRGGRVLLTRRDHLLVLGSHRRTGGLPGRRWGRP